MVDKFVKMDMKGSLWSPDGSEVIRKGSIQIDGRDRYFSIIKGKDGKGNDKYELTMSVGLVYVNDEKKYENTPDIGGKVTIDGEVWKFGGWKRTTEDGREYTSVGLDEVKEEEPKTETDVIVQDDDIPF